MQVWQRFGGSAEGYVCDASRGSYSGSRETFSEKATARPSLSRFPAIVVGTNHRDEFIEWMKTQSRNERVEVE